jgi:hypothetical protein
LKDQVTIDNTCSFWEEQLTRQTHEQAMTALRHAYEAIIPTDIKNGELHNMKDQITFDEETGDRRRSFTIDLKQNEAGIKEDINEMFARLGFDGLPEEKETDDE